MPIPKHNLEQVKRHLRAARQTRNMPLQRVADALHLDVSIIEGFETGRWRPTSAELQRLCKLYGLNSYSVFWPSKLRVVVSNVIGARME